MAGGVLFVYSLPKEGRLKTFYFEIVCLKRIMEYQK